MSSHPPGLRFSSYSTTSSTNNGNLSPTTVITKSLQQQPQQANNNNNTSNSNNNTLNKKSTTSSTSSPTPTGPATRNQFTTTNSLSGSETDISTSTENLSMEQRYVLKHTPRVEPQGQENLQENANAANENKGRFGPEQRYSSNVSTDSTRYASSNRSLSEARNPIFAQSGGNGTTTSNRNSLKEVNSNRSSMDVSTCSYNTLIIHNDDSMYSIANRDYPSPPPMSKKERPRSYGEQGMQEITEIPDDYLNQSHVLKHLANEIKLPAKNRNNNIHANTSEGNETKENQKFEWIIEEPESPNKSKSKSQPDLTKLPATDADKINVLMKENTMLKQQLIMCNMKVAKTQKLEEEVAKVYRVYEELVQSCDRREKLERVARMRLQENLQKVQTLNRALKDQVDIFQSQLLAPSEHQILIAQLFTQNKELCAAKERQDIELAAQQETLQEQRTHIGILDTALTNAQRNIRRLEEELRKKQICIDRLTQLCGANKAKQNECKMRLDYETELSKDSNRSGSSTNSDSKWQLQEKNSQMMRLESEARHLEEQHAMRQNASKLSLEKTSQETDRIIAEAKHDKLRCLEEVHSAQRKVGDLQSHLKILESRLAEKDALIRALQSQKISGSSFDSYNLSTDSYALHPLRYNSPSSYNVSNNSYNTTTAALLDVHPYGGVSMSPSSTAYNHHPAVMNSGLSGTTVYGQTGPAYNHQSVVNLQSISIPGNYSPNSSNYSASYDPNSNYLTQNSPTFNTSSYVDNQYDEHMKKQIDEQLSKFETLQRGLCCFPGLSNKKPNQPLLSDEVSVLSTNNSDAFLQKLAHLDQRDREQESQLNKNKTEEIVLLEKQGRCSQKTRSNASGNLAQVTQTVGQNMTDISNIGNTSPTPQNVNPLALPPRKERGNSLPPSALPRPPRSLKPPRKIDYDRLSDSELKKRSETPPKISPHRLYEMKTSSLKRDQFPAHDYAQAANNFIKESLSYPKNDIAFKRKDYGAMGTTEATKFGFKNSNDFLKPEYTSTKKYQRLEDSPKLMKIPSDSGTLKRSLLPSSPRKVNVLGPSNSNNLKTPRDSYNSHISANSNQNSRNSPMHVKGDSNSSHMTLRLHSKTPPKYMQFGNPPTTCVTPAEATGGPNQNHHQSRLQPPQIKSSLPVPNSSASLPPKPADNKSTRRGPSISRNGENRYRIQF